MVAFLAPDEWVLIHRFDRPKRGWRRQTTHWSPKFKQPDSMSVFPSDRPPTGPQTVAKGLAVLSLLKAVFPQGLGATEVSRRLGIDRVGVQRLFLALDASGWVRKGEKGQRFFVEGSSKDRPNVWRPHAVSKELHASAADAMRKLAKVLGDAVFLVGRDCAESVGIDRAIGSYPMQILTSYAGKRHPLGVGSSGMALLASLPEDEARSVVDTNAIKYDQYGISVDMIHRLRANTHQRGYAVMQNYAVRGALGIGCALTQRDGMPLLAMSVSAITDRMPIKRQAEIAALLRSELECLRKMFDSPSGQTKTTSGEQASDPASKII